MFSYIQSKPEDPRNFKKYLSRDVFLRLPKNVCLTMYVLYSRFFLGCFKLHLLDR